MDSPDQMLPFINLHFGLVCSCSRVIWQTFKKCKTLKQFWKSLYVHLPEEKQQNKLSPKSELMIFLGFPAGVKAFHFMRLHNNSLFIGTTAMFDETIFPKCPDMKCRGVTEIGQNPDNHQEDPSEQNDPQNPPLEAGDNDNFFPSNHFDRDSSDQAPPPKRSDVPDEAAQDPPLEQAPGLAPSEPEQERRQQTRQRQLQQEQPLRRSSCQRKAPSRPDNVYGDNRTPTDIERDLGSEQYWRQTTGDPSSSRNPGPRMQQPVPGPSSAPPNPTSDIPSREDIDDDNQVTKLVREGGVPLIKFLMSKAIPAKDELPTHFCDIARMPASQQKE